jgi:hypothetical protein
MKRMLSTLLFTSVLLAASSANAGSYFGTIWLVQNSATAGTLRFVTISGSNGISLFASGDFKEVLLQGFYKKAKMSIGYKALSPCPVNGTCGTVYFVTVDTTGY